MALVLHYSPTDASMAPHCFLAEIGAPFSLAFVDRSVNAQKSPAYLALNPNGLIPVLVDGGLTLFETGAILLHLTDRHAPAAMQPPFGSDERAEFYKWLVWTSATLHTALIPYFYPDRSVEAGNAEGARQVKARAEARVGELLDIVEARLAATSGPWMLGERFTALDPYLLMLGGWTRQFARPAWQRPRLDALLRRVATRPASQAVFAAEGVDPLRWLPTLANAS